MVPESSTGNHSSSSPPIMGDWHWNLDIIVLVILTTIRAIWLAYPGQGGVFNHAIVFLFLKVHSIAVPSNPAFPFVRIPPWTSLRLVLETFMELWLMSDMSMTNGCFYSGRNVRLNLCRAVTSAFNFDQLH